MIKKQKFTVAEKEYAVLYPTPEQLGNAQVEFNRAFSKALDGGSFIRARLDSILRQQKLWDDDSQKQFDDLREKIYKAERQLEEGGIKKSEGRKIALDLRKHRDELAQLIRIRNDYDYLTAEAQSENARFDYLVWACLVYNDTGKRYFDKLEDYKNSAGDEVGLEGAKLLAQMIYNLDPNYEKSRPENKFLIDYGFANESLELIDKQGRRIDEEGRLVDKDGFFINENGDKIDIYGEKTEVVFKGFIDDETGEVVGLPKEEKTDEVKPAKLAKPVKSA